MRFTAFVFALAVTSAVDSRRSPAKNKVCPSQGWQSFVHTWIQLQTSTPSVEPWPAGIQTCPNIKSVPVFEKEPQTFQPVEDRPVFVFSAYYERRPLADGPCVRIIAGGLQVQFNQIGEFYCQIWYHGKATPAMTQARYDVIYRSIGHGDMWTAHFLICPLPKGVDNIPFAVSVIPEPCSKPSNQLLILNRQDPNPTRTFGVCLSAVYGRYRDWIGISEMFEMYSLLGSNEIVVYNYSLSRDTNTAMEVYLKDPEKTITVVQWQLPKGMDKTSTFFQRGVLNDCLYRLSHKHQFISVQDLDEVMVPRSADTWLEVFDIMYRPNRAIYMFQHSYFRRNTTDEVPYTITQSSFWTTKDVMPAGKIRCKSMYNGLLAKSIDVHYHYELLPGTEEYMVPPDIAKLHHYRYQPMESFRKNPNIEFIEDKYMEKYKAKLMQKLRKSIDKINTAIQQQR